jgi:hypothetical protein
MLTIEIDGRTAIPVRALPFVTEGSFAPEDLVGLFYDPESHCDAEFREPVCAYRVAPDGSIAMLSPSKWKRARERLLALGPGSPDSHAHIECLLPGAFVWLDEFKAFYDFLIGKQLDAEAMGRRPAPAGEFGWDEAQSAAEADAKLVWEGFGIDHRANEQGSGAATPAQEQPFARPKARATSAQSRRKSYHDPEWQSEVDRLMQEAADRGDPTPTHTALADKVARKFRANVATVLRRTNGPRRKERT